MLVYSSIVLHCRYRLLFARNNHFITTLQCRCWVLNCVSKCSFSAVSAVMLW